MDSKCCDILCKTFLSKPSSLKVKSVDISYNNFGYESLCKLGGALKSWNTTELILSINGLYDRAMMENIVGFTKKLKDAFVANIPWPGITDDNLLLVNYVADQNRMIPVCASNSYITSSHFINCKLNDSTIKTLTGFTTKLQILAVAHINFTIHISDTFATKQLSFLPANIQSIWFVDLTYIQKVFIS